MGEVEWEMACDLYTSFFSTTKQNERDLNLDWLMEKGGPLLRIFKLLRAVVLDKHARKHDIFSNGCGKLLFYEFFTLHARQDYLVAISTTGHPFQDWCGIHSFTPEISGVVDLAVRSWTNDNMVVGEVKGESGVVNDGLWQLVAALHVIKGFLSHWPVGKLGGYFRGKGGGGGGDKSAYKRGDTSADNAC